MKTQWKNKKINIKWVLLPFCMVCTSVAFGQWQQWGDDIYYTAGNVGIGEETPAFRLEVKDTRTPIHTLLHGSYQAPSIGVWSQVIGNAELQRVGFWADMLCQTTGNLSRVIGLQISAHQATADNGVYGVHASGEEYNYFSGNVGIGVEHPETALDVAGTVKIQGG